MKALKFVLVLLALSFGSRAFSQTQALVLGYSQTDNVYEDDNIKAELVRMSLRITNKTDKTIFIDRKSSFYYINENPICFFEGKETHFASGVTKIEQAEEAIAPKGKKWIANLRNPLNNRRYNAGGGSVSTLLTLFGKNKSKYGAEANYLGEGEVNFMGYMETMRYELANNENQSCSKLHLTGDESFLKAKVSVNYSLDPKMEKLTPFTVETWVSEMVMSKYYVQPKDKVVRTHAVNVQGRMLNILHVFADSPFEYDEDESPLDMYTVTFGKGEFSVHQFNNVMEENNKKSGKNEIISNFEERSKIKDIFVWEGESTNWVQALTDSYAKFLEEDGAKPKEALKEAKDVAKKAKKEQTLKL